MIDRKATAQAIEFVRQAYARLFEGGPTADDLDTVDADLRRFCRVDETTFHPDPRVHAMLEGRREVYLHMQQYATMTTDEIIEARTHRDDRRNYPTNKS